MRKDLGKKALLYPQPVLIIGTYNEDKTPNAMVAAWGCVNDFDKVTICIDKTHKTMDNIRANKCLTVSMATAANIKQLDYLGITSGHKVADKFVKSGLSAVKSKKVKAPIIKELPLTLECKVMSYDEETELLYTQVVGVSADESILNAKGKVDIKKLCPLCYDPEGHGYYALGEKIGNAFKDGKSIK